MKCPRCDGNGKYKTIFGNTIICDFCYGTGEVTYGDDDRIESIGNKRPQTNEEWLRSASTEQLAEWIFNILLICSRCGDESQSDKEKIKKCPFGKIGCTKKDWVEWLKQPHNESSSNP